MLCGAGGVMCEPQSSLKALIRKYEADLASHEAPVRNAAKIKLSELRHAQENLDDHLRFMEFESEFLQ